MNQHKWLARIIMEKRPKKGDTFSFNGNKFALPYCGSKADCCKKIAEKINGLNTKYIARAIKTTVYIYNRKETK